MVSREKADSQQPVQSFQRSRNQRTFFGEAQKDRTVDKMPCHACNGPHAIQRCQTFPKKSPTARRRIAKHAQMCYGCLSVRHYGNKCPNSQELHHRLLHQTGMTPGSSRLEHTELKCVDLTDRTTQKLWSSSLDSVSSLTEGKVQKRQQQTLMLTHNSSRSDYIALQTVPIILRNGDSSLKVDALLDEASTKTYLNTDVAAELG